MEGKEKLFAIPSWWPDTRTDWPTGRRSKESFDLDLRSHSNYVLIYNFLVRVAVTYLLKNFTVVGTNSFLY
jgi:hypothetical protein